MRSEGDMALELEDACIHEAGHLLVCRLLGGFGCAEVWLHAIQSDDERACLGQFLLTVTPSTEGWRPLVGLAGLVAEFIHHGHTESIDITCEIDSLREQGYVSSTDEMLMGEDWNDDHVARVSNLLRTHWTDLLREAHCIQNKATAA